MSIPELESRYDVNPTVVADDTGVAAKIFCVGDPDTYDDPQVVFGSHDIALYKDYANTVLDTDLESDGTWEIDGGTADVTWGTFAAKLNALDNWACVLVGALHDDLVYDHSATADACVAIAADSANAQACNDSAGTLMYFDTSAHLVVTDGGATEDEKHATLVIGPEALGADYGWQMSRVSHDNHPLPCEDISRLKDNPELAVWSSTNTLAYVQQIIADNTTAAADFITVYAATQFAHRQIYRVAGGGNGTAKTVDLTSTPVMTAPGERLVVRYSGTTLTGPTLAATGGFGVDEGKAPTVLQTR